MEAIELVRARLEQHGCATKGQPHSFDAQCPAHTDAHASLRVSQGSGEGEGVVIHCHAGCPVEDVLSELGLEFKDLYNEKPIAREPEAVYTYTDEIGRELYQVVRFPGKEFRQRCQPTQGGPWVWKLGDTRRVLYRLPHVLQAVKEGKRVWIVEGEADADALVVAGVCATCNPGGAGKWRDSYSAVLRGAKVVVIADKDVAGRKHAENIKQSLTGIAAEVKLGQAAKGKDARDHLRAGMTIKQFEPLPPLITTLCGSTRFPDAFRIVEAHLGMQGRAVFSVAMMGHADEPRGARSLCSDGDETTPEKRALDGLHFGKIVASDTIFVINVGGYVGSSTRREILYAKKLGKPIEWLFPDAIPRDLQDEAPTHPK